MTVMAPGGADASVWDGPSAMHQLAVRNLTLALVRNCPRSLEVLPGPVAVRLGDAHVIRPDLVIVKRASLPTDGGRRPTVPVLVADVTENPTDGVTDNPTDGRDRSRHRRPDPSLYARHGIEHYWHVELTTAEFVAHRWDRDTGTYRTVVTARGDERVGFDTPVLAEICPARLGLRA